MYEHTSFQHLVCLTNVDWGVKLSGGASRKDIKILNYQILIYDIPS